MEAAIKTLIKTDNAAADGYEGGQGNKFQAGKLYGTRSICDSGCLYKLKVVRRSEKSVWLLDPSKPKGTKPFRKKIEFRNDVEITYPDGKYSMAFLLDAKRDILN